MKADLIIERRINQLIHQNGGPMPYQSMLKRLQQKLLQERNQDKRDDIEVQILMLLAAVNMQKGIDQMVTAIEKMVDR